MLLASSIRALIFLPNVRFYKTNFESRIQKKIHLNLNASSSRSLFSLSTFSTIPQQLHTIDDQTVQENYYIPYTEKQISFKHTHLEASEKETGGKNDPSLNQNKSEENEPKGVDEYTLNVGRAIRTIRDDLPLFFEHGLSDTSIYSSNILLTDPHHTRLHVRGKHIYIGIANLLRWSLIWYFDDLTLELVKLHVVENDSEDENKSEQDIYFKDAINDDNYFSHIKKDFLKTHTSYFSTTSISPSDRNTRLYIRWTFEGTPRSSYIKSMFSPRGTRIPRTTFSGIFMYRFDPRNGLVLEHHVKHIIPAPSRKAVLYHGFGGFGGLLWRIRSSMRQQKNEWGVGLGMVVHESENNKSNSVRLKTSKDKNDFNDHRDIAKL
ncbi:hypothetical protein RhiirA1_415451 [Rhizophagus irregularis]|uniref:Uncharacterized protein n=3 Tax=Rhizophagus irregularis TaxID=588596 RepID=A0A2N0S201_9GLOM|nr:hypothetical protein GLOIN_2v1496133 [Rhizophagus irregularis DAOM 181602=DAOM 197198]EXX51817.1 hypothetical protein RirG_258470 [Rhizophagus irregularis DAOM 197198w]PKC69574.1 hypothetical protein RhiirA1_415451 [Rhizophagus irregularis]POG82557.1 hypothetical protein GLOIN_2v1496133 [Rhizophagus irregularis DAOM 181602=DAOM 197198]UZO17527.1 hypothetical protein OCT59_008879 [Rhizophagus irregularis]CAB4474861.1 unnamed protein product [Rhizophagus irregularis]|eukprot:XP_025189423.1 hypothetical protein GLOIN_2v1496133 [Rhizophagus irregularis DAOM 181602=DAOM 197198]